MRRRHLDLVRQSKEGFADPEHPIYHLLWEAGVDQVREAHISTGSIKLLPDPLRFLN